MRLSRVICVYVFSVVIMFMGTPIQECVPEALQRTPEELSFSGINSISCDLKINLEELIAKPQPTPELSYLGEYVITAYCPCEECCGKWSNNRKDGVVRGASTKPLKYGETCASGNNLSFGTSIYIQELDGKEEFYNIPNSTLKVEDRVANWIDERYNSKVIDVYFPNHELVEKFGKIKSKVYIKN